MKPIKKPPQLLISYTEHLLEAGCDEAGRGCLAGPVFAAAVIISHDFRCPGLNDSKQLTTEQRNEMRKYIEENALAWAVASIDNQIIDKINILQASYLAMHEAVKKLKYTPELLLIDGNRFLPYPGVPHQCFVKGDAKFASIAAASILAKTHRDEFMEQIHKEFPQYGWNRNKAYPTVVHIKAIEEYGFSKYHRKSFSIKKLKDTTNKYQSGDTRQTTMITEL
ncbi:MAG: ribonuclease HII [Bacteroidales bacterium]